MIVMSITICVANYKGGVGKSKNCILNAYQLAKKGHKTLVIDLDPQANATSVLLRTKKLHSEEVFSFEKTLMAAVKQGSLEGLETEIMDNLYLLPSYMDFANYPTFLDITYGLSDFSDENYIEVTEKKISHLKNLLRPLKDRYEYIFIDVPPTKSYITDSAAIAADYILIVLQTQELSLNGATTYLKDLKNLVRDYNAKFEVCGVLPVLMDNNSSLDKFILESAYEYFGEGNVFENTIPNMARLKRMDNTGITENDRHDEKVMVLYDKVSDELVERINYFEELKNNG